jgi:hypothetical protein
MTSSLRIYVVLNQDTASALHGGVRVPPGLEELDMRLANLGLKMEPLDPRADDALLAAYFVVELPDDQGLLAQLRTILDESAVVTAAYDKPADEHP